MIVLRTEKDVKVLKYRVFVSTYLWKKSVIFKNLLYRSILRGVDVFLSISIVRNIEQYFGNIR